MKVSKWMAATIFMVVIACTAEQTDSVSTEKKSVEHSSEEFELAPHMANLQRYLEKMYWSAKEENELLHEFYAHEIEETMEEIHEAGVMEDGVNISYNMMSFGIKALETYEKRIEENGFSDYDNQFKNLINGCNGCHLVSKKGMIVIQAPTVNHYSSQRFHKP